MVRVYFLVTVVTTAIALAIGLGYYEVEKTTAFATSCTFELSLPVTTQSVASDSLLFNQRLAQQEIQTASSSGIDTAAARQAHVDPARVAGDIRGVGPVSGDSFSTFAVNVSDSSALVAARVADAVCDRYVAQLARQRALGQKAEEDAITARIDQLQKTLAPLVAKQAAQLTPAQASQLAVTRLALTGSQTQLAAAIDAPPYQISVLSPARFAVKTVKPRIWRDPLVGAVVGLLASFLVILVVESVSEYRRRPREEPAA